MGARTGRQALRATIGVVAGAVLALGIAACSETGGASPESDVIGISTSQLFVTIGNRTRSALTDIKVDIIPVGRATTFSATWTRLEVSGKRDFSLGDFRSRDGTRLNLRIHRPQRVVVSAVDFNGVKHNVESAW